MKEDRPFSAATSKWAYAQVFVAPQSHPEHPPQRRHWFRHRAPK
jgi:hypothetical protein